jgi:hypothetical protein
MGSPGPTRQGRPVRALSSKQTSGARGPSLGPSPLPSFKPEWHTVPGHLPQKIREAKFEILERAHTYTVRAGPNQPDNLIKLRTIVGAQVQAQAMKNAPVGMSLGYQEAAPKMAWLLDRAIRRCATTKDVPALVQVMKDARGQLGAARKRPAPQRPERPRTGIQIVHGGLPGLGKRT